MSNNNTIESSNIVSVNANNISGTITNAGMISDDGGSFQGVINLQGNNQSVTVNNLAGATIDGSVGVPIKVVGTNNRVILRNAGTISTGVAGGAAVSLGSGNDSVTLEPTSSITGYVDAGGGTNTFALGGNTISGSFDISEIGAAAQYRNFQNFQKVDANTWTLTGTGSGPTNWTAAGGVLRLGSSTLGINSITTTGGDLAYVGGVTNASSIILSASASFIVDDTDTATQAGVVSGAGALTKTGTGSLTLTGANTYTGGTTISAGTLQLGNGGTSGSLIGNVTNNGTLAFNRSDTVIFGGVVSGIGNLQQNGTGTTTLTSANTYTGGTAISAGTLQLGNGGTAGSLVGNVTNNGELTFNRSDAVTFDGVVSGTGNLQQNGSGTTILTGANTYTGGTTISAGTLQLGNGGVAGSLVGNVTNNGELAFNRSDSVTFDGVVSGIGNLQQNGSGTTTLTGANTYSGGTVFNNGQIQAASDGVLGASTGALTFNGGGLQFGSSFNLNAGRAITLNAGGGTFDTQGFSTTVEQNIGGVGQLTKTGIGTAILTGANTYTGGTTISSGTLQLGSGGTSGSLVGNVTNNGTLAFNRSDAATFGGVVSGIGNLQQDGSGTTILTGANTYIGGTTISAGTLQLGNGGTAGSLVGNVTNNGELTFNRSDSVTFDGVVSGTGNLQQNSSGTTILTGVNTYTGGTIINAGTLQLGDGGAAGSLVGNVTNNGTLAFNRSDTVTFDGILSGSGGVDQLGSGSTVFNGTQTYTGPTRISAGTLVIGDADHPMAALVGGGATTVEASGTFGGYGTVSGDVSNQGTVAVANALSAFAGNAEGSFTVNGTLTNSGLAQIGSTGTGNTLRVTNYVGQNGSIALNAVLGGDGSPSDQLVIDGGRASGTSSLLVNNTVGQGALTPGNGILLVNAINGGTTFAGAFALGSRVVAGPYEYKLYRGGVNGSNPDDWYLRTVADAALPSGDGDTTPNYRREVSTYAALSSMMVSFGSGTLGTLQERIGDESSSGKDGDYAEGVWTRAINQNGRWVAKSGGIYRDGPSFDDNFSAVQVGHDLFREEKVDGSRNRAGVYGVVGHGSGSVENYDGSAAGSNRFDAYSFGTYWTHYGAQNAYVDTVLQGTWYRNVRAGAQLDTDAFGFAASVEGGYPFQLKNQWRLEPQAQLIYQRISVENSHDAAADVRFGNVHSTAGRVGARLARTWVLDAEAHPRQLDLWLRGNVWNEFSANPQTKLSSENGYVPFRSDLKGGWYEVTAGMSTQVSRTVSIYANLGYQEGFNHGVQAVNSSVGIKMSW
jgi:outer membrane autotransporter protein